MKKATITLKETNNRKPQVILDACEVYPYAHGSYDWLVARQGLVTASEIGIILGYSSWSTPLELYNSKKATITPSDANERGSTRQQSLGLHLEQLMVEWAEQELELDRAVLVNSLCVSKDMPLAGATVDGVGIREGEQVVLEMKTDRGFGDWDSKDLPRLYIAQVNWQMFVTGINKGYLCILPNGNADKFTCKEVVRDNALIDAMLEEAGSFMARVQAGEPPPAMAGDLSNLELALETIMPKPTSDLVALYKDYLGLQGELDSKTEGSKKLEKSLKDIKARMAQAMGKYAVAYVEKATITRSITKVAEKKVEAYEFQTIRVKKTKETI